MRGELFMEEFVTGEENFHEGSAYEVISVRFKF